MIAHIFKVFEMSVHISFSTLAEGEVKAYFSQFGAIKKCYLPFNKDTGFHKGTCWISFISENSFRNALQREEHVIEGVKLDVRVNRSFKTD
uniref:SRA stem-loop interacting RNA binding protein n=1 Tax=Petromyzon marinus TaxID=7757 RepID=S4RYJ3_PETMA